jgi:orotate phosphoribosyltransferase
MSYNSSSYHIPNFNPPTLRRNARLVLKIMELNGLDPDVVAFSGVSGAAICFAMSVIGNVALACVRKEGDISHGMGVEAAERDVGHYVIVDDLMSSGETIRRIVGKISDRWVGARLDAILLTSGTVWSGQQQFFDYHRLDGTQHYAPIYYLESYSAARKEEMLASGPNCPTGQP